MKNYLEQFAGRPDPEADAAEFEKLSRSAVFIGDVFDEQHEQDVVFVLTGVHAAAQLIAEGPDGWR